MPLVVTSGVLVRIIWTKGGAPHALNVFGGTGLAPSGVTQALADALGSSIKGNASVISAMTLVGSTIALASVGVRSIGALNQPEFLDTGAAVPGSAVGNLLPPQVAICITLRTALAGKSYRGRSYFGGYTVSALVADGTCTPGAADAARIFVGGVQAAMTANGISMAIVSRKLNTAAAVTGIQLRDAVFDTIRRRATAGV